MSGTRPGRASPRTRVSSSSAAASRAGIASRSLRAPRAAIAALRTVERPGRRAAARSGGADALELADLAERLGGGGADGRRRARQRPRPAARPPAFALNRPSAAITRAWRLGARGPPCSSRLDQGLDRDVGRRSPRRPPARRRGPARASPGRGPRRSGRQGEPCRPSAPKRPGDLAADAGVGLVGEPLAERRQRSRSFVSRDRGDRREPDRGGGSARRVADRLEDERRPLPVDRLGRRLAVGPAGSPTTCRPRGSALRWPSASRTEGPGPLVGGPRRVGREPRRGPTAASGRRPAPARAGRRRGPSGRPSRAPRRSPSSRRSAAAPAGPRRRGSGSASASDAAAGPGRPRRRRSARGR